MSMCTQTDMHTYTTHTHTHTHTHIITFSNHISATITLMEGLVRAYYNTPFKSLMDFLET